MAARAEDLCKTILEQGGGSPPRPFSTAELDLSDTERSDLRAWASSVASLQEALRTTGVPAAFENILGGAFETGLTGGWGPSSV